MPEIRKIIGDAENSVKKAVSTSSITTLSNSTANTMRVRQDLDGTIVNIANRATPLRDRIKRVPGQGQAFEFNLRKAYFDAAHSPRNAVYADGALPGYATPQFYSRVARYVSVGLSGSVTGLAQAQADSLVDLYAGEVETTTRKVIQDEEWLNFWGSTSTLNDAGLAQYSGLDELISTNIIDASGATISKTLIDKACELIAQQGGLATAVYSSIRTAININNIFNNSAQVIINGFEDRDALVWGNIVRKIQTVVGVLDVVPDFFINPGNTYPISNGASSTPSGNATSTVFILAEPFIEMKELKPIGMEELGRTADKRDFFVNEYCALKLIAEPWCAKIINVADAIV